MPLRFAAPARALLLAFAFTLGLARTALAAAPEQFPAGDGLFTFSAWDGPPLPVYFHAPANLTPRRPSYS